MVGGWADAYRNAVLRVLEQYHGPRLGLIGPWSHHIPFDAQPGPSIGFLQECLRWFDHWLKGHETGIMDEPLLRAWMQESVPPDALSEVRPGRWVAETEWPPSGREPRVLWLAPGCLRDEPHPEDEVCSVVGSLETGQDAGDWLGFGRAIDAPVDQRAEDGRSLSFDTEPLTVPLEILGVVRARLLVSSDQPVALVAARLCDVAPDGSSTLVTRGLLNLTHRESDEWPAPLPPGEPVAVALALNAIAHSFPPGHRLRLAISPTYWPWAWPSPVTATLTLRLEGSSLELPVRPRPPAEPEIRFAAPAWAPNVDVLSYSPTPSTPDDRPGRGERPFDDHDRLLLLRAPDLPERPRVQRGHAGHRIDRDRRSALGRSPLRANAAPAAGRVEGSRGSLGVDVLDGRRIPRDERHRCI